MSKSREPVPIQLKLWPDEAGRVLVPCELCGHPTDVLPHLRRRQREIEERVLDDPRVKALRGYKTRYAFLQAVLPVLLYNHEPLGVSQIAYETGYSVSGAHRHVRALVRAGILLAQPKRAGGAYQQYRLALTGQISAN